MARTKLFDVLRRAHRITSEARRQGRSARPLYEECMERRERRPTLMDKAFSRRDALRTSLGLGAIAAFPVLSSACSDDSKPQVGIVGAGVAGLHAGYRLDRAGIPVTIFDAWNRAGGRTFTARNQLEGGQLCELGGELIDTGHATMRGLAAEFGLTVDDLSPPAGVPGDTYFIGGQSVSEADIIAAYTPVQPAMKAAYDSAEAETGNGYEELDNLSIRQFLDGIPAASPLLKTLLEVAYVGEYGREIDEQSALNLVYLIGSEAPVPFQIFGDSDEAFHIREGSEAIAERFTEALSPKISLQHRLEAIRRDGSRLRLSFDADGTRYEQTFDQVILTLPFNQLRKVDIEAGLLPQDKTEIIDVMGYGLNTKLMLQTNRRVWLTDHNASGSGFADNGAQSYWDTARGQPGDQGIFTYFVGGNGSLALGQGTEASQADKALPLIDQIFPGTSASWNQKAIRMHWPEAPFHEGSYSCYQPGQWQYYGIEGRREGNIHFAGEHTSLEYQGYMEGAAETGLRAANDILADVGMMPARVSAPLRKGRAALRQLASQARARRS